MFGLDMLRILETFQLKRVRRTLWPCYTSMFLQLPNPSIIYLYLLFMYKSWTQDVLCRSMQDQLILPATLAEGTSRLLGSKVPGVLSRHFHRTCLTVTSSFNGTDLFVLKELTLHATALVFYLLRRFLTLNDLQWVIPGTRTQVRSVDWTGWLQWAQQRPRQHYTSRRRWFRALASRHVGGGGLVTVGVTDARLVAKILWHNRPNQLCSACLNASLVAPGRWLLRDQQAELQTWGVFGRAAVGSDPNQPGSRYVLDRQGVESVVKQSKPKWNHQLPSTVQE